MSVSISAHWRLHKRVRFMILVLMAFPLAALAWAVFTQPTVRVVYNASDSVPVGWYRIRSLDSLSGTESDGIPVGSIVLAHLPTDAAALAAQRGYLPSHILLLKRVGAIAPQHVCIYGGSVRIDGVPVASVLSADASGRPLPSWQHCRQLVEGELFLLSNTNPASFDSRYFGPVSMESLMGVAQPIRLESPR